MLDKHRDMVQAEDASNRLEPKGNGVGTRVGHSLEMLEEQILPHIAAFLRERGLTLSLEKTCITHISEGFDFLGQTIRAYNGKLIIKPSKKSLKAHLEKIRNTIRTNKAVSAGVMVTQLNPIL